MSFVLAGVWIADETAVKLHTEQQLPYNWQLKALFTSVSTNKCWTSTPQFGPGKQN
jgi:hypothetical protein